MRDDGDAIHRTTVRMNLALRTDQKTAIEELAEAGDLTPAQVVRRLLDLGLEQWPERRVAVGVAG